MYKFLVSYLTYHKAYNDFSQNIILEYLVKSMDEYQKFQSYSHLSIE